MAELQGDLRKWKTDILKDIEELKQSTRVTFVAKHEVFNKLVAASADLVNEADAMMHPAELPINLAGSSTDTPPPGQHQQPQPQLQPPTQLRRIIDELTGMAGNKCPPAGMPKARDADPSPTHIVQSTSGQMEATNLITRFDKQINTGCSGVVRERWKSMSWLAQFIVTFEGWPTTCHDASCMTRMTEVKSWLEGDWKLISADRCACLTNALERARELAPHWCENCVYSDLF